MKSESAKTAKAIREELKKNFPNLKFKIHSSTYSMGSSVDIYCLIKDIKDIIRTEDIQKITNKYEYGHFDGMTDYYDIDNSRDDIPQVKYIFSSVEFSPEVTKTIVNDFNKYWGEERATYKVYESYHFNEDIGQIDDTKEIGNYWLNNFIEKNYLSK